MANKEQHHNQHARKKQKKVRPQESHTQHREHDHEQMIEQINSNESPRTKP